MSGHGLGILGQWAPFTRGKFGERDPLAELSPERAEEVMRNEIRKIEEAWGLFKGLAEVVRASST